MVSTDLNQVRVLDSVELVAVALRLDLVGEEREAQTCSVVLQSGVVTALQALLARVATVAVVVRLLAEVELEPFLPALLPAGQVTGGGGVEGGHRGRVEVVLPIVTQGSLSQFER